MKNVETELVNRLVGYLEYKRALSLLDVLLNGVAEEELKVIEAIIQDRDELAIYVNLSRRIDRAASTLAEPQNAGDDFRRHGLAWMMALARVELGAMAAGFTDERRPFALIPPSRYELSAYKEVLLDSFRTHYAALRNDPVAQKYSTYQNTVVTLNDRLRGRREINEPQAIAYARRAAIAVEIGEAVQELGAVELTAPQHLELKTKTTEVEKLYEVIMYKVLGLGSSGANWTTQRNVQETLRVRQVDENRRTGEVKVRDSGPG